MNHAIFLSSIRHVASGTPTGDKSTTCVLSSGLLTSCLISEVLIRVTREVIRSRYISSAQPDMSRVTVRLDNIPSTVIVEGRTDWW